MHQEQLRSPATSNSRLYIAAFIVILALGALVGSLAILVHHFPPTGTATGSTGTSSSDSSGSIVSILTPLATAITAIVGLYFGISGAGSARGQTADAQHQTASYNQAALKAAAALTPDQAQNAGLI